MLKMMIHEWNIVSNPIPVPTWLPQAKPQGLCRWWESAKIGTAPSLQMNCADPMQREAIFGRKPESSDLLVLPRVLEKVIDKKGPYGFMIFAFRNSMKHELEGPWKGISEDQPEGPQTFIKGQLLRFSHPSKHCKGPSIVLSEFILEALVQRGLLPSLAWRDGPR